MRPDMFQRRWPCINVAAPRLKPSCGTLLVLDSCLRACHSLLVAASSEMGVGDELAKRRVPCVIAYLSPFRIIESPTLASWSVSIEGVNQRAWDYAALHEMAGGLHINLPHPYHLVVARDGALALPPIEGLKSDQAIVACFNRSLGALLIGGVYCEAVTPDSIDLGSIIDWHYIRSYKTGRAATNRFHEQIRYRAASALEAIALYRPRTIAMSSLTAAMQIGLEVLSKIPTLQADYLLRGVTGIARRDWGVALANLWIVAEQIISLLWQREIIAPVAAEENSRTRIAQLNDSRTWTASARIEMLHQKGIVRRGTFNALGQARKARNLLSHQGVAPTDVDARASYTGVCGLLSVALGGDEPPLFAIDLSNHSISDPFAPPERAVIEPSFWMEIPKLPGEAELELLEAKSYRLKREPSK